MHQGRSILVSKMLFCALAIFFFTKAQAQLNRHDEVIDGVQDINLQDDSQSGDSADQPANDEEFQKKQMSPEQQVEDEIKKQQAQDQTQDDGSTQAQGDDYVPRKEIKEEQGKTYEEELQDSAERNAKKVQKDMDSEDNGFEIDSQEAKETNSAKTNPTEDLEQSEEITAPVGKPSNIEVESTLPGENKSASQTQERTYKQDKDLGEERVYTGAASEPKVLYDSPTQTEKHLSDAERERLSRETKVDIEAEDDSKVQIVKEKTDYNLPFRERRPSWTHELELSANQYQPENYYSSIVENQSVDATYKGLYGNPKVPMATIALDLKKNYSWGAISVGVSGSYFQAAGGDGKISFLAPAARANVYLDTLFNEPYAVPYATFGDTYFMYKENYDDGTGNPENVSGKTDAFFVGGGLLFQLDWMDPSTTALTHQETGIENTFVFVEGRKYMSKGFIHKAEDPDFSSGFIVSTGLKFEF